MSFTLKLDLIQTNKLLKTKKKSSHFFYLINHWISKECQVKDESSMTQYKKIENLN